MHRISEVMTREVITIRAEENIQRAAQLLDERQIGAIPVVDGDKLIGLITDRDITVRVSSAGESPEDTRVGDVMSRDLVWCCEDQSIDEVAQQMRASHVCRIPVVAPDSMRMVGMVSLGELAAEQATVNVLNPLPDNAAPSEMGRQQASH